MKKIRPIQKVFRSIPTIEGAGVHLKRAFGFHQVPLFDPFLMLDDFHSSVPSEYLPGFPWHPHRGIETITYVLHGKVEHGDSMENRGTIAEGDVQWMTAGNGIIHQEMPKGDSEGFLWGFQLWANLPASHKMMDPRYREVKQSDIPEVTLDEGVIVKVIAGAVNGAEGPVKDIVTHPEYLDVTVPAESSFFHHVPPGRNAFAYVLEGNGYFDRNRDPFAYPVAGSGYFDMKREALLPHESTVLFGEGDHVSIEAGEEKVRFLLVSGVPIREPVAWYGPVVMNTQEELRTAFAQLREGNFLKQRPNS